jgi:putative oxidoreductase
MSEQMPHWMHEFDDRLIGFVQRNSIHWLRITLAIVFFWFGALKLFGVSPVADLVASALPFLPPDVAVRSIGALEVLIALGLVTGWAIRVTMLLFFAQMAGTFLILVLEPGLSFQHGNPLLLTTIGEFVVKNLVLISAGLVVAGNITPAHPRDRVSELLLSKKLD